VLFVAFGIVNALLTFGIYALALVFLPYFAAYSLSYVAGIFLSLYLNARFVFRSPLDLKKVLQYPAVYVVQYLLGLATLYVFVQLLAVNELVASPLTLALTVPVTFLLSRFILKGRTAKLVPRGD
jgi:putative flippase GtrA